MPYQNILDEFVNTTQQIMEGKLTGIYLHGSMAMGCFNPKKSDIVTESYYMESQLKRCLQQYRGRITLTVFVLI